MLTPWRPCLSNRLTRELEKKFSDRHVVFVAQRRMLPKPTRNSRAKSKQMRPRSRTLTDVHAKILEDLVFPTEIVGKRTRIAVDGSKLLKVYVSPRVSAWPLRHHWLLLGCELALTINALINQIPGFEGLDVIGVQAGLVLVCLP
jgi:hypothetical protein